jgi:integrase
MAWSEVNLERKEWRIPPERSKIGRKKPFPRVVPLVADAVAILDRRKKTVVVNIDRAGFVFPASRGRGHVTRRTKVFTKLKQDSGTDFFPHAVRHELKSRMARLRVPPHVSERCLGHALRGMDGVYTSTGVDLLDEQREALELWQTELRAILSRQSHRAAGERHEAP